MPFPPAQRILTLVSIVASLTAIGCSCDREKDETSDPHQPPSPLEVKSVPSDVKVEVYPQKGATNGRPVVIVVAKDPSYCSAVRDAYSKKSHVLCGAGDLMTAEKRLKGGVAYLRKEYPRHVAPPPAHLITDPAHARVGWRLMLKEPSFFAFAYLPGLKEEVLNNITLRALQGVEGGSRRPGASTLVLNLKPTKRLKFLMDVAARRGLHLHPIGDKPGSLREAISRIQGADERLKRPSVAKKRP